jgi:hypothetical protein
MVGGPARLHPNQASRLLREERQHLAPRQPTLDDDRTSCINPVHLKN